MINCVSTPCFRGVLPPPPPPQVWIRSDAVMFTVLSRFHDSVGYPVHSVLYTGLYSIGLPQGMGQV